MNIYSCNVSITISTLMSVPSQSSDVVLTLSSVWSLDCLSVICAVVHFVAFLLFPSAWKTGQVNTVSRSVEPMPRVYVGDGQIQLVIWFKSWLNHTCWFDLSTKDLTWKHVIWFQLMSFDLWCDQITDFSNLGQFE